MGSDLLYIINFMIGIHVPAASNRKMPFICLILLLVTPYVYVWCVCMHTCRACMRGIVWGSQHIYLNIYIYKNYIYNINIYIYIYKTSTYILGVCDYQDICGITIIADYCLESCITRLID